MSDNRPIAVTKLADYAADPVGFCQRRGGPRSKKAVAIGQQGHDQAGQTPGVSLLTKVIALGVIALITWAMLG